MKALAAVVLLAGCGTAADPGEETCTPEPFSYSRDSELQFSDLQALGTHNSYHVETTEGQIQEWEYTHAALGTQLRDQGVRQFELDLYFNPETGELDVLHVPVLDPGTTCATLADCVREISDFSLNNPAHHPLTILLEYKSTFSEEESLRWLERTEEVLRTELGVEHLVLPSQVRADAPSLKAAIESNGWPTLGELRGKSLFVLHSGGSLRTRYVESFSPEDWLLFPDAGGNLDLDYAAVHSLNDPIGSFDQIQALVMANHLVRTRADANLEEGRSQDTTRLQQALESGAHFVSTDFPTPQANLDYLVEIPEGTPSRCNPLSAADCTSEDVENPEFMGLCD